MIAKDPARRLMDKSTPDFFTDKYFIISDFLFYVLRFFSR